MEKRSVPAFRWHEGSHLVDAVVENYSTKNRIDDVSEGPSENQCYG